MLRDRLLIGLVLLTVCAFALRLGLGGGRVGLGRSPGNYREYVLGGQHLLVHGTFTSPFIFDDVRQEPSSLLPPVYLGIVASAYALLGTETVAATLALQILNALASAFAVPLVFLAARRLGGRTAGWLAAAVTTVNPALIGYAGFIWDTSLFTLGVAATVYLALGLSEQPVKPRHAFGLGLWLGALALLNPALTIGYPFLVLWVLTRSESRRVRSLVHGVLAAVVGWAIVVTPWTVRNYLHFGEFIYVRGGVMGELWMGVCPEADADPSKVCKRWHPFQSPGEQAKITQMGEHAYLKACGQRAREAIAADPWRWLRLVAIRALDYWAGTVFTHVPRDTSGWPASPLRAAVAVFVLAEVIVLALGMLIVRRVGGDAWWLLAIIVSFSIVYCLTHVEIRYRAPTEPLMAILLAILVARLVNIVRARQDR